MFRLMFRGVMKLVLLMLVVSTTVVATKNWQLISDNGGPIVTYIYQNYIKEKEPHPLAQVIIEQLRHPGNWLLGNDAQLQTKDGRFLTITNNKDGSMTIAIDGANHTDMFNETDIKKIRTEWIAAKSAIIESQKQGLARRIATFQPPVTPAIDQKRVQTADDKKKGESAQTADDKKGEPVSVAPVEPMSVATATGPVACWRYGGVGLVSVSGRRPPSVSVFTAARKRSRLTR